MNTSDCPLSHRDQTRNLLIYAANVALMYLASPVSYVGVTQANLLKLLQFDDTICNLPASVYLWATPFPILVAWAFPQVRLLKPMIMTSFLVMAGMGVAVGVNLVFLGPSGVVVLVVAHAAVLGCANGVVATGQWEIIGKGVSESRRGQALGLAFGAGPVLAVIAALGSDLLLSGSWLGMIKLPNRYQIAYPWNFAILFFASAPIFALAALLSRQFVVPLPFQEVSRQPFVQGVFGGFGRFFGNRIILIAATAYILVYAGHEIMQNLSLYARDAIGHSPEQYAPRQLALRFGFKVIAGFFLGWLLMVSSPKMLLFVTASLTLIAIEYALVVPGVWYLASFGILGAGELFGVYYPNYILGCSPKSQMRRNMAFASLVTMPVGFAPVLYGEISERYGYAVSFMPAMAILAVTIILVSLALPARPQPRQIDMDESDLAQKPKPAGAGLP